MSEDIGMVLGMFREWQKSEDKMLVPAGAELLFRGFPVNMLRELDNLVSSQGCEHPEMNMSMNVRGERIYWCSGCKKQIAIPYSTMLSITQSDLAGIIGLAFGQAWEKRVWK